MRDILEFQGEFRWLSNFWPVDVVYDGELYPSVENAYQASKTYSTFRYKFISISPGKAKRLSRTLPLKEGWEKKKLLIMENLLRQKFSKGTELGEKLISTGEVRIMEGNKWGDTFWGVCFGKGENNLGKLIMKIRKDLIEEEE